MTIPVALYQPREQWQQWLNQIARTLNLALSGKLNAAGQVTLTPSATNTVIHDSRIGKSSHIGLSPMTASASMALASGGLYVVPSAGQATITHPPNAAVDQTFMLAVIG